MKNTSRVFPLVIFLAVVCRHLGCVNLWRAAVQSEILRQEGIQSKPRSQLKANHYLGFKEKTGIKTPGFRAKLHREDLMKCVVCTSVLPLSRSGYVAPAPVSHLDELMQPSQV